MENIEIKLYKWKDGDKYKIQIEKIIKYCKKIYCIGSVIKCDTNKIKQIEDKYKTKAEEI